MPHKDLEVRRAYLLTWQRNMRANLTPEEKAELQRKNNECRRKQYAANPEIRHRASRRGLLQKYGLTLEQYDQMIKDQKGLCLLCHEPLFDEVRKPVVDHSHKTEEVRGILHARCNTAIGMLRDSPERCRLAAEYLERFVQARD
jgi:hypothetical protein